MAISIDSLKKLLQQHLTDGLALVIGSGLSCAEGIPGMGALASHLVTRIGPGLDPSSAAEWRDLIPAITGVGLEAALLKKPSSQALEDAIRLETARLIRQHETRIVQEVFSGKRTLRLTRLIRHLRKAEAGIPVVTTNYDRLVEVALEEGALGVDTLFVGSFAGRLDERESRMSFCRAVSVVRRRATLSYHPRAIVCKPHGSLDWYVRDGTPVRYAGDLDATPLIITPGQNKFRGGYESPFDLHRERANKLLDNSKRLLVIGYGFNDDHLETHLVPAIRKGRPTVMLTHTLSATALDLAKKGSSVIALEHATEGGKNGTRAYVEASCTFFPDIHIWDLEHLIVETLT